MVMPCLVPVVFAGYLYVHIAYMVAVARSRKEGGHNFHTLNRHALAIPNYSFARRLTLFNAFAEIPGRLQNIGYGPLIVSHVENRIHKGCSRLVLVIFNIASQASADGVLQHATVTRRTLHEHTQGLNQDQKLHVFRSVHPHPPTCPR